MKFDKNRITLLLTVLLTLSVATTSLQAQGLDYEVIENIVYYQGTDYVLKLDIAYPSEGNPPFPALLYIFGGGWGYFSSENRSQYKNAIKLAAMKGYVAAAIDYRLTSERQRNLPKWQFPDQVHDVKNAVRWLRANVDEYRIDPARIGAVGWSSGAHLALMLGLTDVKDRLEGQTPKEAVSSEISAVVSIGGPTEMTRLYNETKVPTQRIVDFLGGTPTEVPEKYLQGSPINYVTPDDPPTLLIHGDLDKAVPLDQAQLMDQKMNAIGLEHSLVVKKYNGHVNLFNGPEVWQFLESHLRGR